MSGAGRIAIALAVFSLFVPSMFAASLSTSLASMLANYGINNTAPYQAVNISYSGSSYIYLLNNGNPFFLINVSKGYTFVLSKATIAAAITEYTLNQSLSKAGFASLGQKMSLYMNSSAKPINDCLIETGLSEGLTCTAANSCLSCAAIPVCNQVLEGQGGVTNSSATGTGGYGSPFGLGLIQFAAEYNEVNASYNTFVYNIKSINASNVQARLGILSSSFNNVSVLTQNIGQNPIFPPTTNITNAQLSTCITYPTPNLAPWYCVATGFCNAPTYNYSLLNGMRVELNQIDALPFSGSQINSTASAVLNNENSYIIPKLNSDTTKRLNTLLNTTLKNYSTAARSASILLTHVSNSTLSTELSALEKGYANLTTDYLSLNLTRENKTLSAQLSSLQAAYLKANAMYSGLVDEANNNTLLLVMYQLNGNPSSSEAANLSFQQLQLSTELSGKVGNTVSMQQGLDRISVQAGRLYGSGSSIISTQSIAREINAPFAVNLADLLKLPYSQGVALAPIFSILLGAVISLIIILFVFLNFRSLKKKNKLVVNHRTRRNWRIVFAMLALVVIAYLATDYTASSAANASAPLSAFSSALGSSKTLALVISGNESAAMSNCAGLVASAARSLGKNITAYSISGIRCTASDSALPMTADQCLNQLAYSGTPAVILSSNLTQSLAVYSFYGTYVSASGSGAFMNECYPARFVG